MHELVIVLPDLYLSRETRHLSVPDLALPALEHVTRFADRVSMPDGWRRWLGRVSGLADEPVATVTASSVDGEIPPGMLWMATPVHVVAGISSAHLDRRSLLVLPEHERDTLAAEFTSVFHDSGFGLVPLSSGEFLLCAPGDLELSPRDPSAPELVLEPARVLGDPLTGNAHAGSDHPRLRRLSAEIEMWLHENAVNLERSRRGLLPVTGLWLWGPGPAPRLASAAHARPADTVILGCDGYLAGLRARIGQKELHLPDELAPIFGYPPAQRFVLEQSLSRMLHRNPALTFFEAVARIDRQFIAPAVAALGRGDVRRLVLLANDHALAIGPRSRYRFWRPRRPGLSGLQ